MADIRKPPDFPLFGPPERWISNPLRLLNLQDIDRSQAAAGLPTRHDAEIADLLRADLAPEVGRYYPASAELEAADSPERRADDRRRVEQWLSSRNNPVPRATSAKPLPVQTFLGAAEERPVEKGPCSEDYSTGVGIKTEHKESVESANTPPPIIPSSHQPLISPGVPPRSVNTAEPNGAPDGINPETERLVRSYRRRRAEKRCRVRKIAQFQVDAFPNAIPNALPNPPPDQPKPRPPRAPRSPRPATDSDKRTLFVIDPDASEDSWRIETWPISQPHSRVNPAGNTAPRTTTKPPTMADSISRSHSRANPRVPSRSNPPTIPFRATLIAAMLLGLLFVFAGWYIRRSNTPIPITVPRSESTTTSPSAGRPRAPPVDEHTSQFVDRFYIGRESDELAANRHAGSPAPACSQAPPPAALNLKLAGSPPQRPAGVRLYNFVTPD